MNDGINRVQPSLGLMLIGQMLENCGHIVKIHEKNKVRIGQSDEDIENVINDFFPDVVAISALFSNFLDSAHNIARLAKKVNKNIKVILERCPNLDVIK